MGMLWTYEMRNAYRLMFAALIAGSLLILVPVIGQARPAPDSCADLAEKLTPAVVNIATSFSHDANSSDGSPFEDLPPGSAPEEFHEFFNRRGGSPMQPITSLGSGFIVDPNGLVVTNNHVIADADEITVVLNDNSRLAATVIGRDPKTDLALLKVENGKSLPYVEFGDSDGARVGDWVIAIGNPFGLGNTVTAGILSARGRDINAGPYDDFLQTDAPINRGNSGGPMFDMNGKVIGVNTLIYSPSGGSVGIGFATPSAIVGPVIAQLREFGQTRRGWLGVRIQSVAGDRREPQSRRRDRRPRRRRDRGQPRRRRRPRTGRHHPPLQRPRGAQPPRSTTHRRRHAGRQLGAGDRLARGRACAPGGHHRPPGGI